MLFMVYDMHLFSIYWTHLTLFVWSGMRKKGPDGWTCCWWWSCAVLEQVAAAATITQLIIAACPRDPQSVPTVHHQQGRALHPVLFQATHCAIHTLLVLSCQLSKTFSGQKRAKIVKNGS